MKVKLLVFYLVILMSTLCGCSQWEENLSVETNSREIMDGMNIIYADNTNGYAFGLDTKSSYQIQEDGIYELETNKSPMYFSVESAGDAERELAVQIFVDYVQVPIIIDGKAYDTFFIDATEKFSQIYEFRFAEDIDMSKNHKILGILTAYSNILIAEQDVVASGNDSLCIDGILSFSSENILAEPLYPVSEPLEIYEGEFGGFLLNTEKENIRKIPQKKVSVKPSETLHMKYHVGDDGKGEEAVILVNIANKQTKINGQQYYYCHTEAGKIAYGDIAIQAPEKPGLYEITAWSVPKPFSEDIFECNISIPMAMRFTLEVSP